MYRMFGLRRTCIAGAARAAKNSRRVDMRNSDKLRSAALAPHGAKSQGIGASRAVAPADALRELRQSVGAHAQSRTAAVRRTELVPDDLAHRHAGTNRLDAGD